MYISLYPSVVIHYFNSYTTFVWLGAEGQFMPTWHSFEPEVKPRQSRKRSMKMLTNSGKDWKKMKEKKKKTLKMQQTFEKRRETKRKSGTERRIQHIKKIRNEKVGMNLKRKKKSGWYISQIKKSNFFSSFVYL